MEGVWAGEQLPGGHLSRPPAWAESPRTFTTVPDTRESQSQGLSTQACNGCSCKFRTLAASKRIVSQNSSRALPKQLVLDRLIQVWEGNSLTVLWLGCHAFTHGKWVRFLIGKLRFLVPYDVAKKKRKEKKEIQVWQDWPNTAEFIKVVDYTFFNIKKAEHQRIDAFELWCWRRLLRVPRIARRSNQSILKKNLP